MEQQTRNDLQLAPNMIMCGDHPSITKTELNAKESKPEEKDQEIKKHTSYGKITPTASHTRRLALSRERVEWAERPERAEGAERSERAEWAERTERIDRLDIDVRRNRALMQAAIGSFRWPPYLLCVWVLVLVLTHVLHCLVNMLEKALPALRSFCEYFRAWTEESWRGERERRRGARAALAGATAALYALYCALYALHALAAWAVEPLAAPAPAPAERGASATHLAAEP